MAELLLKLGVDAQLAGALVTTSIRVGRLNELTSTTALGAGATASSYPVIYGFFTVDNATALFKTEDQGENWQLISDAQHGFGAVSANDVGADMAKYGR